MGEIVAARHLKKGDRFMLGNKIIVAHDVIHVSYDLIRIVYLNLEGKKRSRAYMANDAVVREKENAY